LRDVQALCTHFWAQSIIVFRAQQSLAIPVSWEDFNLCKIEEITVRYDGKKPTATFT